MKRYLNFCFIGIMLTMLFYSCSKDESMGPPPEGNGITESITASPGDIISFIGTFTTESQFNKISLTNDSLLLNKEIVFANKVSKYYLEYQFTIPESTIYGIYTVKILAESTDGASQEFSVSVNISSVPEASGLSLNISANPGEYLMLKGTLTDAQGLSEVTIQNTGIGLDTIIALSGNPTEYALNFSYKIPTTAESIVHKGSLAIYNIAGRVAIFNMEVNLTGQAVAYTEMYAAGGFQWWTWNAEHAYMMLPDATNNKWFEIIVPAWPEDDYNQIKFVSQLAWEPNNWGLIDNTNPSGGMLNADNSQPILLDAASSSYYPAYFKVRFNPYDMQYTSEEIDQAGFAMQDNIYIVGAGFPEYPNLDWNPEEAIQMVRNPDGFGEHIFAIYNLQFSDDVSLKFIGQNDGWGPLDIGFDTDFIVDIDEATGGYQVQEPVSWVPTKSGDGTADLKFVNQAGAYTVLYDHFAKRAIVWKEE